MKVAIFCPHGARSGGPEALHQLAHVINKLSPGSGYICYHDRTETSQTYGDFNKYQFIEVYEKDINDEFVVVLPEVYPEFVERFSQPVYYWWLSATHCSPSKYHLLNNVTGHLAQSVYAAVQVEMVFKRKARMLSDYIHPNFHSKVYPYRAEDKEDLIVLNPAKRESLCDLFIKQNPDLPFVKLQGMTRDEVIKTLQRAKVFIDFGDHPGKDRIPREAVLSGCLPIVRMLGAATYPDDVPIPKSYLFTQLDLARDTAVSILQDYNRHIHNFDNYLYKIENEYEIFKNEVAEFLNSLVV